jgi:hypothetical protein
MDTYSPFDESVAQSGTYVLTTRPAGSNTIYCAPVSGSCGATVPIYRFFDETTNFGTLKNYCRWVNPLVLVLIQFSSTDPVLVLIAQLLSQSVPVPKQKQQKLSK